MKRRIFVVAFSLMMAVMLMVPTAFADNVVYKSTYALSGYPSGAGSQPVGGAEYDAFGGLLLGDVNPSDVEALYISGEYDSDTGDYIVTYDIRMSSVPDTENFLFYVAMDAPIGVTLYIRASYRDSTWWELSRSDMYRFTNTRPCLGFDMSYYPGATDCYAVGINRHCFLGNNAKFQIRISDPKAVVNLDGHGSFLDTIFYPFNMVNDNLVVVNFVSSIWTSHLVAPFFSLAISALAICLIVKFMR